MAKKDYKGSIGNTASMEVKAPYAKANGKKPVSSKGGDLRSEK